MFVCVTRHLGWGHGAWQLGLGGAGGVGNRGGEVAARVWKRERGAGREMEEGDKPEAILS